MSTWWWDWGWGWAAIAGIVLLLGLFVVPWFFFLFNLHNLLERVEEDKRAMAPSHVWLNFIPVFWLGWFLYTVMKVRDSVSAVYDSRGWWPEGDLGYNVGIAAGVLGIVGFFLWWVPVIGWLLGIAWLVCWIIYWLKTADLSRRLAEDAGRTVTGSYPPYCPPAPPYGGPASYAMQAQAAAPAPFPAPATGPAPAPASAPGAASARASAPVAVASAGSGQEAAAGGEQPSPRPLCMACGAPYDQGDKFCRSCGLPLPQ